MHLLLHLQNKALPIYNILAVLSAAGFLNKISLSFKGADDFGRQARDTTWAVGWTGFRGLWFNFSQNDLRQNDFSLTELLVNMMS